MSTKLYVGNLSYTVTSGELDELFSEVGEVVASNVITDRETGRSRGFGFVEMDSPSAAQAAIERFNGREFQGRNLVVNEARPRVPRPDNSFNRTFDDEFGGERYQSDRRRKGGRSRERFDRPARW